MSEGSRLSRWSQRKLAAKKHGGALPEQAEVAAEAIRPGDAALPSEGERTEPLKPQVAGAAPEPAETMLTEADLPSIDGLTAQSDYTVFLKNNVPEALRKAALRKLWVSDPVLANLDGLNDYDDDYTIVTAMTMDDTTYKLGRGLLDDEPKPAQAGASESLSARTEPSKTPEDSDKSSDVTGDASHDTGNSDAPPVASPVESRSLGASGPDTAQESAPQLSKSPADPAK